MKTAIIIIFSILLMGSATSSISRDLPGTHKKVKVDPQLRPFFNEFVRIVKENNIKIDWAKLRAVDLAPLGDNIQGWYAVDSDAVFISYYHRFPRYHMLTNEEKDALILLTLAHEVGHSQGFVHTDPAHMGLMNPSSKYDLSVVRGMGAEKYIILSFKAELDKKR